MEKKKNNFTFEGFFKDLSNALKDNDVKKTEQCINSVANEENQIQQERIEDLF